jgi:hypothetical protein
MKFAVSDAKAKMGGFLTIAYFFNARGEAIERSIVGTYRSLLVQLIDRIPYLLCSYKTLALSRPTLGLEHQWSVNELESLLELAVLNL